MRVSILTLVGIAVAVIGWLGLLWVSLMPEAGTPGTSPGGTVYPPLLEGESVQPATNPIIDHVIYLGYALILAGMVSSGFSSLIRILQTAAEEEPMIAAIDTHAAPPPVSAAPQAGAGNEETVAKQATIVDEGVIEGCEFIEYSNGIVDLYTPQGWQRFPSKAEAIKFLTEP